MFSTLGVIDSGITQGMNFSPLVFLLHLNDLSMSSEILDFVDFNDDTLIFLIHQNSYALYVSFNEELCEVSEWLWQTRYHSNVGKTCYMITRK